MILSKIEVRNDREGQGHYKAPRGNRLHKGVDIVSKPNENVYAPIGGIIRNGIVSSIHRERKLVAISRGNEEVKLMYVSGNLPNGTEVKKGDIIGVAQDTRALYNLPRMLSHVHVEHL